MPFAPPVTIAARPDSLAMALLLRAHAADEFFEFRELLLDHANGRLILELERLLVEFLRGEGDDDLGPAEQDDVDGSQRLPQMILHARAAEDAAGGRLQRHRLVLERLLIMRDTQSIAFLRSPGIDQLYSGDTMTSPSAPRMASAQAFTSAGKPVVFWMSKL